MRKAILFVIVAMVVVGAVSRARREAAPAALARQLIADRIWLDHIPRSERDTVQAFFAGSEDAVGLFGASSQWRGGYELFRYEASAGELRVVYPQTGEREKITAKARRCSERDMDFCLEIEGASRGVKKYYSRKGWEVSGGSDRREIEARVEALRGQLVADHSP
jgi:hypothetical protein